MAHCSELPAAIHYELITRSRHGHGRVEHGYVSEEQLGEGDLVTIGGGHGWMMCLVDPSALGAAGFHRVRKVDL